MQRWRDRWTSTPGVLVLLLLLATIAASVVGGPVTAVPAGASTMLGTASGFAGAGTSGPAGIGAGADAVLGFTSAGNGSSGSILPGVPGKPAAPVVSAGPEKAKVDWTPPDDGGTPIIGYTVTASPGGATCTWTSGPTSCVITGLAASGSYTFTVTAVNGVGSSVASDPSTQLSLPPSAGTFWGFSGASYLPTRLARGPDGNMWFLNRFTQSVGRITPAGVVSIFSGPSGDSHAITPGPDGNVWFTSSDVNSVSRISPTGVVTTFTDAGIRGPEGITTGPDGNLWFANFNGNTIGQITPTGVVSVFSDDSIRSPIGIAAGPDGALWFTNFGGGSIGRITVQGAVSTFADPGMNLPREIATGPDGSLWFTDGAGPSIGRIAPAGATAMFTGPGISAPSSIAAGPDGNMWFTNDDDGSLGWISMSGAVTKLAAPQITSAKGIAAGPDGSLWFANGPGTIGRSTTNGQASNFVGAGNVGRPIDITAGPDGNLWFTDSFTTSIGRISSTGAVASFVGAGLDGPRAITSGPDGNLWFANGSASIGRVTPAGVVSIFTGSGIAWVGGIVTGPDGALWFTNVANDTIGRITTAGVVSSFTGSGISRPAGITAGPDGALWFTNPGNDSVGRITTGGVVATYTGTGISKPAGIAAGPDGALWFTNAGNNTIGRITAGGQVSNFTGPGVLLPQDITAGPDGALWFTNKGVSGGIGPSSSSIGRISTAGVVSSFTDRRLSEPLGIVAGPDGALWFANSQGSTIGWIWPGRAPGAPAKPAATAGKAKATVTWMAPVDGGSAITGYTVTAYQDGVASGQTCSTGGALTCDVTGLTNGVAYTFTVKATNAVGTGAESPQSDPVTPTAGALFHPLDAPTRILDSRPPPEQVGPFGLPWAAGTVRDVTVAGVGGVPADATAVTLNVTVTGTTAASFLTIWPKGDTQPTASNLNWSAGQTIPNAVTVKVGAGGLVQVFNPSGAATVIIDVVGYYDQSGSGDGFTSQAPARVLDSRPAPETVGPYSTPWAAGTDRDVTVAGVAGVPADADAVVLNATVTGTTAESFLTIYPNGATKPTASSLNWKAGVTIPNAVTVKVGTGGKIRVFNNSGNANVIIDVVGYFKAGTGDGFHPVAPVRFADSRPAPETVGAFSTPWGAGVSRSVSVLTGGAVPAGAKAILANFTVTSTSAESFATVWNTGAAKPTASSLNWKAGVTIANAVTAKVGDGDTMSVFNNSGTVNVIADVGGWYG